MKMTASLRVLILEDNKIDAELMLMELRRAGFDPASQVVEDEAQYLENLDPALDVILADYNLPNFDALRALRLLQKRGLEIPFIVVTATLGDEVAVQCMREGATDYLLKDRMARLGQAVANATEARRIREEKQRAEKALRQSDEKYKTLVESVDDAVYLKDTEARFTVVNSQCASRLGMLKSDIIGKTALEILPATQARKTAEDDARVLRRGITVDAEYEISTPQGPMVVHVRKVPLRNEVGEIIGLVAISRDITERKKAEDNLKASFVQLQKVLDGTVRAMALTVETRDPYTAGHQQRVARLSYAIAREVGLGGRRAYSVRLAAVVHDIGKMAVPAEILSKPGSLTPAEFAIIKIHPRIGFDILEPVGFPWPIAQIVHQHHERMNGSGYPTGLSGEDILMESKILGVADVVEAMSSHRPYRPSLGIDKALQEISHNKGILYDLRVADACLELFRKGNFDLELS